MQKDPDRNVVGGTLLPCSNEPVTGFFRDGCCSTGPEDLGSHTVCAVMTEEFLAFSRETGNDLSTPRPIIMRIMIGWIGDIVKTKLLRPLLNLFSA